MSCLIQRVETSFIRNYHVTRSIISKRVQDPTLRYDPSSVGVCVDVVAIV